MRLRAFGLFVSGLSVAGVLATLTVTHGIAGEIRFGNAIPGLGLVHKRMVSVRERKFINLVPQETDFSCGAASVATILNFAYGQDRTEDDVLVDMLKISDRERVFTLGFSLLDIKRYVETLGFQGEGFEIRKENLLELQVPVIALIDLEGYKHFVIVKKVVDDKVYVGDPALGNYILAFNEFVDVWENNIVFAIIGEDYNTQTVLRDPAPPLSAKRLLAQHIPVFNANVLDFGISHADFF